MIEPTSKFILQTNKKREGNTKHDGDDHVRLNPCNLIEEDPPNCSSF
jgi:hypothetical protein